MYRSQDIADRIKQCAKKQGISIKKMLSDIGLGCNTMANMKLSMPKADNLAKIADYLNTSVDYLLGRTDVSTSSNKPTETPKPTPFVYPYVEYEHKPLRVAEPAFNEMHSSYGTNISEEKKDTPFKKRTDKKNQD